MGKHIKGLGPGLFLKEQFSGLGFAQIKLNFAVFSVDLFALALLNVPIFFKKGQELVYIILL